MLRLIALALCLIVTGCYTVPNTASVIPVKSALEEAKERYEFERLELERHDQANKSVYDHYNAVSDQVIKSHREIAYLEKTDPSAANVFHKMQENAKASFDKACAERTEQYNRVQSALAKVRELSK